MYVPSQFRLKLCTSHLRLWSFLVTCPTCIGSTGGIVVKVVEVIRKTFRVLKSRSLLPVLIGTLYGTLDVDAAQDTPIGSV